MFAWEPSDIPGVPREVIEHHLAVCPGARPVKQKVRRQAQDRQEFIVDEVTKLQKAGFVKEVLHPTWVANPVVVPKANGKKRLCIDFTDINKACPKDPFPLPRIDQIVDSTAGCDLLSFLDAYSGYHQIMMAREDKEKTAFITPCGTYCYVRMPFGLKSTGATFQRAVQIGLVRSCIGMWKLTWMISWSRPSADQHSSRIWKKLSAICRKIKLKLNSEKCIFGVPSGKLLGFFVSHRGIEANPDKIKAIEQIQAPRRVKDIQRLNGCVAALGRFISKLAERALPFFKVLKKSGPVDWTPEAEAALQDLKKYLSSPPILVAPSLAKRLLLYVAATNQVVSTALVSQKKKNDPGTDEPGTRISQNLQTASDQSAASSLPRKSLCSVRCTSPVPSCEVQECGIRKYKRSFLGF